MPTLSARVPDDLDDELKEYVEEEHLDRSTAVRKLISEGLSQWRLERALTLLDEGRVTLSRAAEIADMNVWEITQEVKERDISYVSDRHGVNDLDDL